ncbi:MAG: hypothetical protein J5780_05235 [Treponema sp.]|nr:hypothetical protein [Treponema sp.]
MKSKEIPFLIGGETLVNKKEKHNSNSAVLFDSDGEYSGFFSKMHLVPFAEKIPYSETAVMKYIMHDLVHYGSSGWTPGYQFVLFKIPVSEFKNEETPLEYGQPVFTSINLDKEGKRDYDETRHFITNKRENPRAFVRFTTPVCFEDSFSDVLTPLYNSGSEVFMNITNDSWSKKPSAEYQHFAAASFAAIQYRTTMVRCCNSGYSAVILPNGKIMADLPVFTESSMAVSVPVYERKPTVYSKYGDWAAYAVMALFFFFVLKDAYFEKLKRILKIPFAVKINVSIKKGNISDADSVTDSALSAEPKDKADSPAVPAKEKAVPEKKKTSSVKAKSVSEKKNTSKKTADKKTVVKKESEKTSVNKPASGKNTAKKTASEKKAPVVKKEAAKKTSPGKTVSASKKAPAKRKS